MSLHMLAYNMTRVINLIGQTTAWSDLIDSLDWNKSERSTDIKSQINLTIPAQAISRMTQGGFLHGLGQQRTPKVLIILSSNFRTTDFIGHS
jgi:hypothetical protein